MARIDPEKDTTYKHVQVLRTYTGSHERRNGQMKIVNLAQEIIIETPTGPLTIKAALDDRGNAYLVFIVDL